jgi:CRISPR locus-related DNA-binding protein
MKVLVVSLGFSVDLVVRSILKITVDPADTVVLVYSLSGDEVSKKRVLDVVSTIKGLLKGNKVIDCEVTGTDFYEDVIKVLRTLKSCANTNVIASLVGGMRITLFAILYALELFSRVKGCNTYMYLMREDGLYDVVIKLPLTPSLGNTEKRMLKLIKDMGLEGYRRSEVVSKLSNTLKITQVAVRKVLRSLESKKLISVSDGVIKLERLGRVITELVE